MDDRGEFLRASFVPLRGREAAPEGGEKAQSMTRRKEFWTGEEGLRLVEGWARDGEDDRYVYSAQLSRSKRRMAAERLVAEKIDVGADLAERWLPEMESVVFTSATIAVGDDFKHFNEGVGLSRLPEGKHRDLRLDSSFDYDSHMAAVVAKDMPAPSDRAYTGALEDLLFDVHVSMGGSVLTLFTNRRDMERVYEGLRPRLAAEGLDLACQERGTSPRRLRDRFMKEESLSLLALKSFWEGFDAQGDTLRCVVIPKLPFASPNDPLVRERDAREERAWWRYSLPEAVISVKQRPAGRSCEERERLRRPGTGRLAPGHQALRQDVHQEPAQQERADVGLRQRPALHRVLASEPRVSQGRPGPAGSLFAFWVRGLGDVLVTAGSAGPLPAVSCRACAGPAARPSGANPNRILNWVRRPPASAMTRRPAGL